MIVRSMAGFYFKAHCDNLSGRTEEKHENRKDT
jgi:elongation factor P hydroxylase